ncbi:hypothetical protein J6590_061967 [Homalodisca vitripennis]|nr:hypothetical protein J6590_061967 [Homalodisca vitripennis]
MDYMIGLAHSSYLGRDVASISISGFEYLSTMQLHERYDHQRNVRWMGRFIPLLAAVDVVAVAGASRRETFQGLPASVRPSLPLI